ncbi:MAG: Ig-like domain-containing protein [Roseburia sp.]|nr:Ig-like domain-containing protein [Roseburia sp.]
MKRTIRRIISIMLVYAIILGGIPTTDNFTGSFGPIEVQAAELLTLQELMNKFPQGKYWNHLVCSGHAYNSNYMCTNCGNPDGYTDYPCATHSGNASVGQYDCNGWYGIQCNGFVRKLATDAYGSMHTSWSIGSIDNVKPGDIIHYYGGGADLSYGHWVMVIAVNGDVLTFGECNYGAKCQISWNRTMNLKTTASSYTLYSAPYALVQDTTSPTLSNVYISDVTDTGYTVYCDATDNEGIAKVAFPTWTEANGQDDLATEWYNTQAVYSPVAGNTYCYKINISDHNNETGKYITHVYAYDAAGNHVCEEVTTVIQPVTGVSLNKTSATLTSKGATTQLTATVSPSSATNKSVTWKSSNTSVATVSSNGLVTAVGNGTATITVTTKSGSKTATCKVTVSIPTVNEDGWTYASTLPSGVSSTNYDIQYQNIYEKYATSSPGSGWVATGSSKTDYIESGVTYTEYGKPLTTSDTVKLVDIFYYHFCTGDPAYPGYANFESTEKTNGIYVHYDECKFDNVTEYFSAPDAEDSSYTYYKLRWSDGSDVYCNTEKGICDGTGGANGSHGDRSRIWYKAYVYQNYTAQTLNLYRKTGDWSTSKDSSATTVNYRYRLKSATGVSLNKTSATLTAKGATTQLTATITPADASDKSVTWKSSNTSVATVSSSGLVTAVGNGTATITVTTTSGGKTATCKVTVSIAPTGVSLNKTSATLISKGATTQLTATVAPSNAADKSVTWKSSNTSVATVSSSGLVTAVGNGTATITVTTATGAKTATCKVTVSIAPTGVTLNKTTAILTSKGATAQLTATVAPSNAADKSVTWKSSNTSVATVSSSGLVTAVGNGTATITVTTASGGKTATCKVTVNIAVTDVSLNQSNATLAKVGDTLQLTATVTPSNAANKSVSWKSSDTNVATVSEDGLVTAKNSGTCTITASALDGSGKYDTCEITVLSDLHIVTSVEELESSHPYEVNDNDIWQYTLSGAPALKVTFDEDTSVEDGVDYIYIFDINGTQIGSYTGDELSDKTVVIEGDTIQIQLISDGERCDYGFKVDTIIACEVPVVYNISFDGNGHTSGSMDSLENCISDEAYDLPENTFQKNGYEFVGWNTNADGSGVAYADKENVKNLTNVKDTTVTLYAQWKAKTYTVSFDANGGRVDLTEKSAVYNEPYGELPVPSIVGGTFLGWFTDPYEGAQVTADSIVQLSDDQTLYAHWELVYETANPIASLPTGSEVEAGAKVQLSSETNGAQIYYTTDATVGENVSSETGTLYEDAIAITENVTIYAIAVKPGYNNSEVLVVSYTVKNEAQDWGDVTEEDRQALGFATAEEVPDELWVAGVFDCDYTGKAITYPDLHVYNYKTLLQPKVDYTVKYSNNTKAGTATITITGKGNYAGTIVKTFAIRPLDLSNATVLDVTLPYNGKMQKATTTVTYLLNGKIITLKKGTDFTYTYPGTNSKAEDYDSNAFKSAGDHTVILTGKGNYTGTTTFTQTISEKYVISKMSLGKIANQRYTGSAIEPTVTLKNGKVNLIEGTDFSVTYSNNTEIGTATVTITGIGDYSGTRTATFKITGTAISKAKLNGFATSLPWTGEAVTQNTILIYTEGSGVNMTTEYLTENVDYTVTYQNNTEIGTATVIYTGMGGYTGTVKKTFKITGIPLSKAVISGLENTMEYDCKDMLQNGYQLTYTNGRGQIITLVEGIDYTVTYKNNNKAGTATTTFTGINGYTGTIKKSYKITAHDLNAGKVSVSPISEQPYTKNGVTPKPVVTYTNAEGTTTLVEGKDYTLTYANNKAVADKNAKKAPAVTITGKGSFKGKLTETFTITGSDLSATTMTASDVVYQKKANVCKPVIALYDSNGMKLSSGTDYDKNIVYTYAKDVEVTQIVNKQTIYVTRLQGEPVDKNDIIPVGAEIIATVTGIKNYAGTSSVPSTQSATFRYVASDISKASVKVAAQNYTGKAVEPTKDDITVKIGKETLAKTDYEIVGYSNNVKKGTAKVTIRGIGNYGGEKTVTFKINSKTMNYTITYDKNADDATGTMKASNMSAGKKLSANTYKRVGYKFVGWNTKSDGTGYSYTNKEAFYLKVFMWIFGKQVTLYAQWESIIN